MLVELQMSTRQLDKALGLLNYLENQLFSGLPAIPNLKPGERGLKRLEREHNEVKKVCMVNMLDILVSVLPPSAKLKLIIILSYLYRFNRHVFISHDLLVYY